MRRTVRTKATLAILALAGLAACSSTTPGRAVTATLPTRAGPSTTAASAASSPTSSAPPAAGAAFTDPATVRAILADAGRDIAATNDYDYRHLPAFRRTALAATTEPLTSLLDRTISFIADKAPALHASQTAKVLHIGIAGFDGTEATIVAFGRLTARSTSFPRGRTDPFAATAGVRLVHQRWLLTRLAVSGPAVCDPPGTPDLATACRAAGAGVAAILTFRRSRFDQDFAHALSLLTDPLRRDVAAKKQQTLQAMTKGAFDLRGKVVAAAVQSATPDQVIVLVSVNGYRSTSSTALPQRFVVTVVDVNGHWLLSEIENVGTS